MHQIYKLIKLNRLVRSYRVKFFGVWIADLVGLRHLFLRLDPVNACNLKCGMCYFSDKAYAKKIRGRFSENDLRRIATLFFSRTIQLVIGCAAEPTLYKDYVGLIQLAKNHHIPFVGFTTNGQLLDDNSIRKMVLVGLDEITLSVHGVTEESYEKFMVNSSFKKLHETLQLLTDYKTRYQKVLPEIRINYTVNADNLEELSNFFEIFGHYRINTLQIRPMVDVGNTSVPHKPMDQNTLDRYFEVLDKLRLKCVERKVVFLATKKDPNFDSYDKGTGYVLPAILRTIHPNKVWMKDFNWRKESYREFCKRTHWRRTLFNTVFGTKEYFKKVNHYLTYDVD
jgi:MoaA/NifB/PqqE/SkfB family radical SAM enzyme